MKKIFQIFSLTVVLTTLSACHNAEYPILDNSLYIPEAYTGIDKQVEITNRGGFATFSVRTAQPTNQALHIEIGVSQEILDWFKIRTNNEYYVMLTPEEYTLSTTSLTIEAGKTASKQVEINISPSVAQKLNSDTKYVIALTVKSVSPEDIIVQESLNKYILVCAKPESPKKENQ